MTTACNKIGLTRDAYKGKPSTLCKGCGHDSITNAITQSFYDLGVNPYDVLKVSGIGCSSKTPTYFIESSHGFNGVHGRMPSIATGAKLAANHLPCIGISGDGDTASIGLGQFCHLVRRNVNMMYLVENNGTYGLTKGQFSATADQGSLAKKGAPNPYPGIDLCTLAIELGATFVARSFSGDRKQLLELLKAAYSHGGTAVLDVISPCVTFNNHEGSTKSYLFSKEHEVPLHELGYVPFGEEITVEMQEGEVKDVELHDGSHLTIRKLQQDYDPSNKIAALAHIETTRQKQELSTGLLYFDGSRLGYSTLLNMVDTPLRALTKADLNPGPEALAAFNKNLS